MLKLLVLAVACLAITDAASQTLYKCESPGKPVEYSDQPCPPSKRANGTVQRPVVPYPSSPGWIEAGRSVGDTAIVYVDRSTIRRVGSVARMWSLYNYRVIQYAGSKAYLSINNQEEFDCEGERERALASVLHSGNM